MMEANHSNGRSTTPTTIREGAPRDCLRCGDAPALSPYLYCAPCRKSAYATARQASLRNQLNNPPVQVYRWNSEKKKWEPK